MKTLSSLATIEKNKKFDVEPINLFQIDFGGVIGTKYYSDRNLVIYDVNGAVAETYEAAVADWGQLSAITEGISTTKDITITLINALIQPISDLFSVEIPEGKAARVYQWFEKEGAVDTDKIIFVDGNISSPVEYDIETVKFDIVDKILNIEEKLGTIIDLTTYPRALSSHVGRVIPQVFGSVKNVPAVCVETTGKSQLRNTISDTALTIGVENGLVFPAGAFTLVIEGEEIDVAFRLNNVLNIDNVGDRGVNGTTATFHLKGTQCYEKLAGGNNFRYQVHDGVAKNIEDVRINGLLLDASEYTIDQSMYPGQIVFSEYPSTEQEKETLFTEFDPDNVVTLADTDVSGDNPGNVIDEDKNNFATLDPGDKVTVERVAGLNLTDQQYKRTFITVKYLTNKKWDGSVLANLYLDSSLIGALKQPTFDPDPIMEIAPPPINKEEPAPTPPSNPVDFSKPVMRVIIQSPPQSLDRTASTANQLQQEEQTEVIFPSSAAMVVTDLAEEELFRFTVDDNANVHFLGNEWRVIDDAITFPPWANIPNNAAGGRDAPLYYKSVLVKYFGFSPNPPSGGDWRVVACDLKYDDNISKGSTASFAKGSGNSGVFVNDAKFSKARGITANNFVIDYAGIKVSPTTRIDTNPALGHGINYIFGLEGYLRNVRLVIKYEREVDIPVIEPVLPSYPPTGVPGEPAPDPVIIVPSIPSHTVEQSFEVTGFITGFENLLNRDFTVFFESGSPDIDNLQLFVKEILITLETGKYNFEYSDLITADVEGYYVDGAVITEDYGTLDELITRPDQIVKLLMTNLGGFSLTDLDLNKYGVAGVFYLFQGYRTDFVLTAEDTIRNMIETLCFQVRTDQYWEDGLHVIKVLEPNVAAIKSLDTFNIVSLKVTRDEVASIVNDMELRYKFNYASVDEFIANKWQGVVTMENTSSQADYQVRKDTNKLFFFDKVRDGTTASNVASYYLAYFSDVKKLLKVVGFLDQIELEKHDIVNVTWPLDSLADTPHRVIAKNIIPGNKNNMDRIELLLMREDYTFHTVNLPADAVISGEVDPSGVGIANIVSAPTLTRVLLLPNAALEALKNGIGAAMNALTYSIATGLSNSIGLSMNSASMTIAINRQTTIYDSSLNGFGNFGFGGAWSYKSSMGLRDDNITVTRISGATHILDLLSNENSTLGLSDAVTLFITTPYDIVDDQLNELVYFTDTINVSLV